MENVLQMSSCLTRVINCCITHHYVYLLIYSYHKVFNKRGKNWIIVPEGQLKHYEYIVSLEETIICACIEDELPKARNRGIKPDNPRNIAPNIATVPAPPTSELVARHRTRFTKT